MSNTLSSGRENKDTKRSCSAIKAIWSSPGLQQWFVVSGVCEFEKRQRAIASEAPVA